MTAAYLEKTPAILALSDGKIFRGFSAGRIPSENNPLIGEVVFNTSLYGYQEILTDPSYHGQILCFTTPHIGNVGCNSEDLESAQVQVAGVAIHSLTETPSNFRSTQSLNQFLKDSAVPGIFGISTRDLVLHLREHGSQMGVIAGGENVSADALVDRARAAKPIEDRDLVAEVSTDASYVWNELPWKLESGYRRLAADRMVARPHLVVVDCGVKRNILRLLLESGFRVTVVPAKWTAEQIRALQPQAVFFSNGPGDPAQPEYCVQTAKAFLGSIPVFGICLGHQILSRAIGAETYKLKFGHRGGNHPVQDLRTKKVEITVQNHGFAVDATIPGKESLVTHINLNDQTVEGLEVPECLSFSIQYHPEASPGPHDAQYLFQQFFDWTMKFYK